MTSLFEAIPLEMQSFTKGAGQHARHRGWRGLATPSTAAGADAGGRRRLVGFLGALVLLTSGPSAAWADIGRESGDELLARCEPATRLLAPAGGSELTPEQRDAGLGCIAFVEGFIWGHAWSAWRDRSDMYYCPPERFGSREAVPAIVAYLRKEEGRRVQRAHLLVFAALSHAWPCTPPLSTAP